MAAVTKLQDSGIFVAEWTLTSADPDGEAVAIPYHTDMCVSLEGTIATATAAIQGHNHPTAASGTFLILTKEDPTAGDASTTSLPIMLQVLEAPYWVRASLSTPGSGATVTVRLKATRSR